MAGGVRMKIFNMDVETELWQRMEVRAALLGLNLKNYLRRALEEAVSNQSFSPEYTSTGKIIRKNLRIPIKLWEKVIMAAAKKDVSKRQYICAAIAASLTKTKVTYPTGEETLIIDPMTLQPEVKDCLIQATGNRFSVKELITRFAHGLSQGDERLLGWLREQK